MKKLSAALLLITSLFLFQSLFAQDTVRYSVVQGKDIKGIQKIWRNGEHEYHYFFQYNDRGRGDSIFESVTTNTKGIINGLKVEGVDYYRNPYNEHFSVEGDSLVSVVNDQRTAKKNTGELYVNFNAPGVIEPVIKALLKQPAYTSEAFSGGKVRIVPLHTVNLDYKDSAIHLLLAELYFGENAPPAFIWLNNRQEFFASVADWFSVIQEGYEMLNNQLLDLQDKQALVYYGGQVKSLSTELPNALALTHVRLFDAEHATMLDDMTVLVINGKIANIAQSSSMKIPKMYKEIDAKNKTLMPGLWDMHGHYDKSEGLNYLAGGVTHLRDMGNSDRLLMVRDAIRNNELLGPDISYMSGFIDQAGPFQGPTGAIVKSLPEAIDAVDHYAKLGYQQIKLYSSLDTAWVAPVAAEAHKLGLRVAGHIPSFMTAADAVRDGYDEITHMNMVMLNFLGDTIDTRSRGRFYAVGQRSGSIDLNGKAVNDFLDMLAQKNISLDPTMNVFAEMFTLYPGDTNASIKPIISWMPENERQDLATQTSFAPTDQKETYLASFKQMMTLLKKIYDRHILIVSGTDGGDAFALEHELELYVQAGIPALNALQAATYNPAKDCNLLQQYGMIKKGYAADMILIDGNPAENISDIRRVEWVIKNNRMYDPKQLFAYRGWSYYH